MWVILFDQYMDSLYVRYQCNRLFCYERKHADLQAEYFGTSACKVNITIDYPVNEMKKTLARHIACGVEDLSKLRCNGCEKNRPSQFQHDCLLPDDILIDMHFDEGYCSE